MVVNCGIKKMDKRYGILVVSVTILVLCFAGTASATNWSVDGSGGADFTGIQEAINNASDGDTIIVHSGVYYENVVVYKSVTLRGIGQPVVDAGGKEDAIALWADGITLVGFTATNSGSLWEGAGIKVISSDSIITGNNVSNNVNGIVLFSSRNNTITGNNVSSNNGYGIELGSSSNNTITGNNVCNNNGHGIYLDDSSNNNTITGNNVSSNNGYGIVLWSSRNNTITGNNASSNVVGIILSYSRNNTITGNNASSNVVGIYLDDSSNNTITGNNVRSNNGDGIYLYDSSNNNITCNTFVNNGLFVRDSYQNTVKDNTVNGKHLVYLEDASDYKVEDAGQVILVNCNNITVENLDLSNTSGGIALWTTENSIISNNTVCNKNYNGIYLDDSSNNTITDNNVSNNNGHGIYLDDSSNNTITGNNVSNNNGHGIYLDDSSNNIITGNTFVNDSFSIRNSYHNTVEDNTVNGKPLVYLEDASDCKVEDAGQVILVNCNNITVENLDLSNTSVGIELWETENSKVLNNNATNNNYGIYLRYSSNNIITGNNASNNRYGIFLFSSSNNLIIFNNFINNTPYSYSSTNVWNSTDEITYTYGGTTYKSYLGNYWSDYEGTDADRDGIGDTHYSIDSDSDESDDNPLMKPFENYIISTSAPA